ncbi:hypothetical protein IAU60_003018 [Kwoniella sp. DSM 27419]
MPEKCGLDITLHARFLRGAYCSILMPLHIIYSPSDIAKTSMLRASVSSLVVSSGSRWLWVHALLIWYITITWTATLLWIAWGAIGYRRREIDGLARRLEAQQRAKQESTRGEEATDPQTMPEELRDEETLRDYFTHYIQKHHERKKSGAEPSEKRRQSRLSFDALAKVGNGEQTDSGEVEEVIMVRKLGTIASLRERRMDVLRKLELIFPVSLLCALASLTNIAGFIKPLQAFLTAHPKAASAITSLAPVILVALLTIAICPILLVIANKAETIVTRLGVHNSVMERFWKFLMVNGVVFFAIGQSAIEAYLTAFQNSDFDPLPIIASAFPTAAPYFASYILLQVAIQPFFEIFRFGLPTIVYVFGTRVSNIPRQRSSRTEHPTFSHFSQVPQQLLGGAIMHLFMLLNPLVLPFTLVYYGACYLVWKRQFTYVYGRLYETNGKRSSIRILRYSMDALALGQFVLFAFFIFISHEHSENALQREYFKLECN